MEFETIMEHCFNAAFPDCTNEQAKAFIDELARYDFAITPLSDVAKKAHEAAVKRMTTGPIEHGDDCPDPISEADFDAALKSGQLPKATAEQIQNFARGLTIQVPGSIQLFQNMKLLPADGRLDELARAVLCTLLVWYTAAGSVGKIHFFRAVINNLIGAQEGFIDAMADQQKALN